MSDDEIRAFLQRNPEDLRRFLADESRRGAEWLRHWVQDEQRRGRAVLR